MRSRRGSRLNSARPSVTRGIRELRMTFGEARHRLETTPIARPVIYTLAGCHPGERCVIERTPDGFSSRTHDTGAANDWLLYRPRWEARVAAEALLTRTFDEAAEKSRRRREHLAAWPGSFEAEFDWVTPPVLNSQTPARGGNVSRDGRAPSHRLRTDEGRELPEPMTVIRHRRKRN
jgi:hypothetical protein